MQKRLKNTGLSKKETMIIVGDKTTYIGDKQFSQRCCQIFKVSGLS